MPAKPRATSSPKAAKPRMSLTEVMSALEQAGSEQTRKTYLRHGVSGPLFGVSFATLKTLLKKIGVDHELALELWDTGNYDARNLALKVVDPARITTEDLDRWAHDTQARMSTGYVAALTSDSPHGMSRARAWLASDDAGQIACAWSLVGALAMADQTSADAWFLERVAEIEEKIHGATNEQRRAMNQALIELGCRNLVLQAAAIAAAGRIGKVTVDHGDTACKTPDAASYIEKTWAHSSAKGFDSPAAHERSREPLRLRC